jgi:hypothetical protein
MEQSGAHPRFHVILSGASPQVLQQRVNDWLDMKRHSHTVISIEYGSTLTSYSVMIHYQLPDTALKEEGRRDDADWEYGREEEA